LLVGALADVGEDDEQAQERGEIVAHDLPGVPDLSRAAAVFPGVGVAFGRSGAGASASSWHGERSVAQEDEISKGLVAL
jgi:hypothetical protein